MMRTMVTAMIIRSNILKRKTYDTKRISYYDIDEDDDKDEEEIYMVTSGRPVTVSAVITGIMDIHHIPGGRKGGNYDDSSGDEDDHHCHLACEMGSVSSLLKTLGQFLLIRETATLKEDNL